MRFGSATDFGGASYVPDFGSTAEIATLATIACAYAGLEAGSTMGEEIVEPRRSLPRAIGLSGVAIVMTCAMGSAALLVARLVQALAGTPVLLLALGGGNVRQSYCVLLDMTLVVTFVPMLYLFAALPVVRARGVARDARAFRVPGGMPACAAIAALGCGVTLVAIASALVPPKGVEPAAFLAKVIGGCIVLVGSAVVIHAASRRRAA